MLGELEAMLPQPIVGQFQVQLTVLHELCRFPEARFRTVRRSPKGFPGQLPDCQQPDANLDPRCHCHSGTAVRFAAISRVHHHLELKSGNFETFSLILSLAIRGSSHGSVSVAAQNHAALARAVSEDPLDSIQQTPSP